MTSSFEMTLQWFIHVTLWNPFWKISVGLVDNTWEVKLEQLGGNFHEPLEDMLDINPFQQSLRLKEAALKRLHVAVLFSVVSLTSVVWSFWVLSRHSLNIILFPSSLPKLRKTVCNHSLHKGTLGSSLRSLIAEYLLELKIHVRILSWKQKLFTTKIHA